MCVCVVQMRAVANTNYLAQASWPRLGEMSRGSPRVFYASRCSSEQTLILSERTSRLGGGELAWARVILAWARPSSLSEELGEDASRVVFPSMLGCLNCAYMGYCMMA